jgi:hypothetical protein
LIFTIIQNKAKRFKWNDNEVTYSSMESTKDVDDFSDEECSHHSANKETQEFSDEEEAQIEGQRLKVTVTPYNAILPEHAYRGRVSDIYTSCKGKCATESRRTRAISSFRRSAK